jgi:hypothetical protein
MEKDGEDPLGSRSMKRCFALVVFFAAAVASSGCGSPRLVRGITSRADQVKFLYYEGGDTGVVKCRVGGDGTLSECRPMTVSLEN